MRKIKHCFIFVGAALLVACATQAPTPTPTPTQASSDKFQVPIGYQKTMLNGQERYCRNDVDTGSHISRTTTCYTVAQLKSMDADNQDSIQRSMDSSNALGTAVGAGAPSAGPGR